MPISTPRGAVPADPGGGPPRSGFVPPVLASLLAVAGLCALATDAVTAQGPAEPRVEEAELTANVRVPPVLRVEPRGPVRVPLRGGSDGVDLRGEVTAECAANVPHVLAVRRVGASGVDPARVEWGVEDGSWAPLRAAAAVVVGERAPGRHAPCAVVRFRITGPDRSAPPPEDAWIAVEFEVRPRPGPS